MSTLTPNYGFILPGVNDPTDQDLWGGYLNENFEELDTLIFDNTLSEIPVALTTNYVLTTDDNNKIFLMDTTSGSLNFTLGAASGFDNGFHFTVKKLGASNNLNLVGTVDGATNPSITAENSAVSISSNGTNWYYTQDYGAGSTFATAAEIRTGTVDNKAVAPQQMKAAIGFSNYYVSPEQTITVNSVNSVTHGLGAAPTLSIAYLICKSAELGYSVNDVIPCPFYVIEDSGGANKGFGVWLTASSTSLFFAVPTNGIQILRKSSPFSNSVFLTPASWRIIVKAWA